MTATYSERHLDPAEAHAYRTKFEKTALRRLSHRRERSIIEAALAAAIELLPPVLPSARSPVLLDFPCGAGRFARLFAGAAKTYVGADHSPHMLAICRAALGERTESEFHEGDAREMPFTDATFDLACCVRLLHHFRDPDDRKRILDEFHRVTTGPLVLTFLDADSPKQWVHARRSELEGEANRRAVLSISQLTEEAGAAGWRLTRTWALSGLFSGQAVAVLDHG